MAEAILHHWVYRFSPPKQLHSDQGREFCNQVVEHLLQLLGTKHTTTSAYHPQANAQVERLNRTILEYLRGQIPDDSKDWERLLPVFEFHYNSSFHSSIGMTPFEVLFGPRGKQKQFQSAEERWTFLKELQHKAKLNAEKAKVNQKKAHDKRSVITEFKPGQLVWYSSPQFPNQNHKIASKWQGPATVTKVQGHNAWIKVPGGKTKQVNWHNIKPFQDAEANFKQGEEQVQKQQQTSSQQQDSWQQAYTANLINHPGWGEKEYQARERQAKHFFVCWKTNRGNQEELNAYLRKLELRNQHSLSTEVDVLTPQERQLFNQIEGWERNWRTTGSPASNPEFRDYLVKFPGAETPAAAPPAGGGTRGRGRGRGRGQGTTRATKPARPRKPAVPTDRRLRSSGPAEERALPQPWARTTRAPSPTPGTSRARTPSPTPGTSQPGTVPTSDATLGQGPSVLFRAPNPEIARQLGLPWPPPPPGPRPTPPPPEATPTEAPPPEPFDIDDDNEEPAGCLTSQVQDLEEWGSFF